MGIPMSGAFPEFVARLIEKLGTMAMRAQTRIDGIDVFLYSAEKTGVNALKKALCIVPTIPAHQHDSLIEGINRTGSTCVECVIFIEPARLIVHDLAGLRAITVDEADFDAEKIDCICRYTSTGHLIFLDPVFEDPGFLKQCWVAFSGNLALLEGAGFRDSDQRVRIAMQVVIELCLKAWKILPQNLSLLRSTGKQPVHACVGTKDISFTSALIRSPGEIDDVAIDALFAPWCSIPGLEARLDERILCQLMERSIPGGDKKRTGSYYTPRAWAWYTCHEALHAFATGKKTGTIAGQLGEQDLQRLEILDPAMGSGDFLDAMSLALMDDWLLVLQWSMPGCEVDWNAIRLRAKLEHVFKHNVRGIDMNKLAVDVTRARFFLNAARHVAKDNTLAGMMERFSIDLVHDDFLTMNLDRRAFDIVIGNPPYLMEVRNNKELFHRYSKHPGTRDRYEPKMDVFYFFMFKGIEVLRDRGVLGFVVQEYWLDRFHARNIRVFIFQENAITDLIQFKRCKVFPTAPGQHTMVVIARKGKAASEDDARVITVKDTSSAGMQLLGELLAGTGDQIEVYKARNHAMYDAGKDKVFVHGEAERGFFEHIHAMEHYTIKESEIQVGINIPQPFVRRGGKVEGVFVVARDQAPRIAIAREEQAILKPFHKATDIGAYAFTTREDHFIIYTTNETMKEVEEHPDTFANIRAHLDKFSGVITSDHKPYGLHRPRQQEWFESREKIIGVRKTRSPRFAVVPQDYYMDQAALIIRLDPAGGISPHYACAFLNSPVASEAFSGIKTQGGQLQIDKNVLTRLPIPVCHALDQRVISVLSEWLHVLGILEKASGSMAAGALVTRLRGIIDVFFNRLVSQGGKEPILAKEVFDDLPRVAFADHLIKRRCIANLEHLISTVIDTEGLRASIAPLLPSLERAIDQISSRNVC